MTPKISVIISSYNHEKYIAQAIESVLSQSFADFELLIIDDNSTDNTAGIIKNFKDPRIKFFQNSQNFGMTINTNNLIKKASGNYIATLNSDDYWQHNKLAKQIDFLEKNLDYGACFTLANIVDDNGKSPTKIKTNPFKHLELNRFELLNYLFFNNNFLCYPSAMIRKKILEEVGYLNPAYLILLDVELWIKILFAGHEIKILPEKLTNFRILSDGKNLSGKNSKKTISYQLENTKILNNFLLIKDYQKFIAIFPEYEKIAIKNKSLAGYFYLIDFCFKKIFNTPNKNFRNIKNFIIELIHDKSAFDKDFYENLYFELNLDYQKYSSLISQYPNGLSSLLLKNKSRQNKIITILFLFIFLFLIFLGFIF
ncbi:MAG: glycosyltransferase [Alphaproteobacteria bacterium]|nr:glycosyltransferase [Alphaproteobacteria bacterium]